MTFQKKSAWILGFMMLLIPRALPVFGAFMDQVETFDGTSKDTASWEEYISGTGSITQNNALTINGMGNQIDYTTKTFMVGIGEAVSVEVTPTAAGTWTQVGLCLTTNSGGTTARTLDDSKYAWLYWSNVNNQILSGGGAVVSSDHPLSTKYIYRIERISREQLTYRVFSDNGTQLGSVTSYGSWDLPETLYISLLCSGATATFDNVEVGPISGFNVETFYGTTKDNVTTWEEYILRSPGVITQNDNLNITGYDPNTLPYTTSACDYTTRTLQVGVGECVSVEVTPLSAGTYGISALLLTNNSGGNTCRSYQDSVYFGMWWANNVNQIQVLSGGVTIVSEDHPLNTRYIYRIDRNSATQCTYYVFADNGTLLGSVVAANGYYPQPIYVSLGSYSATTVFDNVRVGPIGGFVNKDVKIIPYGWYAPSPEWIRNNVASMEQIAFDGLQSDVHLNGQDWNSGSTRLSGTFWGMTAWTLSQYQNDYDHISNTSFVKFGNNLEIVKVYPGNIDMFDDTGYNAVVNNARLVSYIVKNNKPIGVMLDPETYTSFRTFCYEDQPQKASHTFAEYQAKAKQRGREFMQALYYEANTPNLDILIFYGYSLYNADAPDSNNNYGLYPSFLNGMLEVARAGDRIYDGYEYAYGYKTKAQFVNGYNVMRTGNKTNGLTDNVTEYDAHYRAGFAIWVDNNASWDASVPANNYFTPAQFYRSLQWAVNYSDKYVWIYNQNARWFDYPTTSNISSDYKNVLARLRTKGKLDTFLGSVKGLSTWEQYVSAGNADTRIIQNNNLEIDGQNPSTANVDYTTQTLTLAVGDKVSAEVTPLSSTTNTVTGILLTNDSGGTGGGGLNDSRFVGLVWSNSENVIKGHRNDSDGYGSTTILSQDQEIDTTYIYEIEWISSSQVKVCVYDAFNQLLGSEQTINLSGMPSTLYISLISNSGKTRFENVWVFP